MHLTNADVEIARLRTQLHAASQCGMTISPYKLWDGGLDVTAMADDIRLLEAVKERERQQPGGDNPDTK